MRHKILTAVVALITILTCWAWYENTFRIDFFATKNRHLTNMKRLELMKEKNIDTLRLKAVKILDNFDQRHGEKDETVIRIQNLLTWITCLTLFAFTLSFFQFRKTDP